MSFKDTVEADIGNIFLNTAEFAEPHTIKFGGGVYENILIVQEVVKQSEITVSSANNMEGVYSITAKAYFNAKDTEGKMPEQGKTFEIDDGEAVRKKFFRRYRVVTAENAMGMVCLELEAYDE